MSRAALIRCRIAQLAGVRFEPVAVTERRVELELLEFVVEMEGGGIPVARGAAFMQIVAVGVDPVEFEPDRLFAFGYERIEPSEKFVLGEGQQRVEIPPPLRIPGVEITVRSGQTDVPSDEQSAYDREGVAVHFRFRFGLVSTNIRFFPEKRRPR